MSSIPVARTILGMLVRNPAVVSPDAVKVPNEVRSKISVQQMQLNMHPTYNEARTRTRGEALLASTHLDKERACFVDAASYARKEAFFSVVIHCDSKVIS
ncbi:hypothetical protein MRX96_042867 [Rhipicephalus microplus]